MNRLPWFKYLSSVGIMLTVPIILTGQNEDELYELSPFTIEENDSIGYQATNTLAGSRLKTPLSDVGSAIQVITAELFEDTGSTTMEEILPYALSMESHGALGNYAGGPGQNHNGRFEQDNQRLNPQAVTRVRGLANADLTRNFFLTDIPFEGYNTTRIAISRGANSLLFGIGSAGGIINNTTRRANADGEDFNEVSYRMGERGSHRETFDFHKVLVEDRVSLRLMGLYKDTQYQQAPAFELDRRVSGSLEVILADNENSEFFGRSKFRANLEVGSLDGTPPNLTPPTDGFTSFFQQPDITKLLTVPGVVVPGYYLGNTEPGRYHPEFGMTSWQPKQTFDNRIGLSRGNVPAVVERNFHRTKIKFNANSPDPITYLNYDGDAFTGGQGAANRATGTVDEYGYPVDQGLATHVLGVDGNPYPVLSNNFEYIESGSFFMGNRNDQRIPNFTTPVILDRGVWDNDARMIQGLTNFRNMEFDSETFVFEQPLWNDEAGIELAYDNQHFEQEASIPFSDQETIGDSGNNDVVIDLNEYLITGDPNPNLGRPMMKTDEYPGKKHREIDRESVRFTGFVNIDFENIFGEDGWGKWLGRHTITGFYNKQKIDFFNHETQGRLRGKLENLGASKYFSRGTSGLRDGNFRPVYEVYLGPDVRNFSSPSDVLLSPINIGQPKAGDSYELLLWNRTDKVLEPQTAILEDVLTGGNRRRNQIETEVISVQSRWLNDHLIGLIGWRDDTSKTWENIGSTEATNLAITRDIAGRNSPRNPEYFRISDTLSDEVTGDTVTWSLVGKAPDEWFGDNLGISLHVSESENFAVAPTRRDVLGNVLAPPRGTTEEYGITFNLFQNKVIARLNWFETAAAGSSLSGGTAFGFFGWVSGYLARWEEAAQEFSMEDDPFKAAIQASIDQLGPGAGDLDNPNFQSFRDVYDEIISWLPSEVQAQRMLAIDESSGEITSEPNPGQTSIEDFVSEGFELDLTANLTPNWRVFLNVAQQEAVESNIALKIREVSAEISSNIKSSPIGQWADTPARSEGQTFESRFLAIVGAPLGAIAARDGKLTQSIREWRVNAVTSYSFDEGMFAGFTVGGGIRWEDRNAIGYPNIFNSDGEVIPELARPFMGPDQLHGDLFLSYRRPIMDGKVDWKIQVNGRNVFGDNDPIPVVINPDGNIAVIRNSQQKTVFLTNTFSF